MSNENYLLFTSESVSEGHPDKIADQISDAILDAILTKDSRAYVACEVVIFAGTVEVFGEISTTAYVDIASIVRETIRAIGYTDSSLGFDYKSCGVHVSLVEQSPDIAQGVNNALECREQTNKDPLDEVGAGDQGMMFGFATNETMEFMPIAITLSHKLVKKLADIRKLGILNYLRPDAKSQVTIEYDKNGSPLRIDTIVISTQHAPEVDLNQIRQDIINKVIKEVIPDKLLDDRTRYLVNPTGRFVIGGPQGDSGLTGRKIIVDTYGGYIPHGGGAFSGKDPTKVDRSGSYAARYIAKNLVAAGLADKIQIQLSYAIGVSQPISINIETYGTGKVSNSEFLKLIREFFDLRPAGIIKMLDLRRPIYQQTAAYGHFGRTDISLPWEQLDKVDELKAYISKSSKH